VDQAVRPRVLIVDDDPNLRRALHDLLNDCGVLVVGEAADGRQGVQLALALLPDIVLMDLRMPVLGGLDATLYLTRALPAVRVIVCTAYTELTLSERAREAGAVAVVAKGDHPREFLAAIQQAWIQILVDRAWGTAVS
jgi:CheY-like chemotaxis protein